HEIVRPDGMHLVADQHAPAAPQDQHGMGVLVALEGGMTAGGDLEVAPLGARGRFVEQHLAGHVPKGRDAFLLVAQQLHAFPAKTVAGASDDRPAHARILPAAPPASRTRVAKSAALASSASPASSRLPPMSSMVSGPNRSSISSIRSTRMPPAGTGMAGRMPPSGPRAASAMASQVVRE